MSDFEDPSGLRQRLERLERLSEGREPDPKPERSRWRPQQIREHLGTSVKPSALRDTCRDLARRERTLRAEASSESFAFLDQEQQALQEKIDRATDEAVRGSLQSALAAVADQRRQRERVKVSADRLDAELTRQQYTLEGMAAGLVRLRTTGRYHPGRSRRVLRVRPGKPPEPRTK